MPAVAEAPLAAPATAPAMPQRQPSSGGEPQMPAQVRVSDLPPPGERASAPPKPGSARAKMMESLRKVSEKSDQRNSPTPQRQEPAKADPKPAAEAEVVSEAKPASGTGQEAAESKPGEDKATAQARAENADGKTKEKVNPWKLVDDYKARLAKAEQQIAEVSKRAIPEDQWKQTNETLSQREKRLAELEAEIKYVNYAKSEEFKVKYQQPYEQQWQRTMSELGELQVETADGGTRPLAANDILDLVNAPLGKAHEMAVERFGDLASEVMAHRKEIRNLFNAQAQALEEAKKSGVAREKELTEKQQREFGEVSSSIKQTWSKSNEEAVADPKYGSFFKPVEGDQDGNQRLAKGFELADRAFSENPLAPGLTTEQREAIVRRHAAIRNRAAAFGRLVHQNRQAQARIEALEKELKGYKGSEPTTSGSQPKPAGSVKASGMDRIRDGLRKLAR